MFMCITAGAQLALTVTAGTGKKSMPFNPLDSGYITALNKQSEDQILKSASGTK